MDALGPAAWLPVVVALALGAIGGYLVARRGRPSPPAGGAGRAEAAPAASGPATTGAGTPPWYDERRLDRVMGALPIGVVVVAEDGSIVHRNPFARRFGSGRHGDALVTVALDETVRSVLAGDRVERPIDVYGPPPLHLRMQGAPITDDADRVLGGVVVIEDVTAALQVDRIRKDFVANVSHELKTPIGAIGLLAETLLGAGEPEIVARLANRLHEQALRLAALVDDLLALSKLESGPIDDPELLDLREVVGLAIERSVTASGRPGSSLRCHEEAPAFVDGDRSQLIVAIANLIDNAIKYSDDGSPVDITVETDGSFGVISVTDHGDGIPEHNRDRVFERFYRVDDARSRITGGTGLGLSIVRHAVLNHHGTVEVDSVEGQGSTFTIRLPLADVHAIDLRDPAPDPDPAPQSIRESSATGGRTPS